MKKELAHIDKKDKSLWCNCLKKMVEDDVTICVDDSDFSDDEQQPAKKPKLNALESKAQRVDALANELREKHQGKYNKIQYKLWAEALLSDTVAKKILLLAQYRIHRSPKVSAR